jgi:hypothetical protein
MFIDGINVASATSYATSITSGIVYVGAENGSTGFFNGYIDELRLTESARYTANFTPPTEPFPDS